MSLALSCSILLMGSTSLLLQVMLLRELMTSFLGNELSVPTVLLSWMLMVAAGSWIAGRIRRKSRGLLPFSGAQLLLAVVIPLAVLLSRAIGGRTMFPGQVPPASYMLQMSALAVAPGCLLIGAQFALACRLGQFASGHGAVSRVYALEAFGAVIAGALFHFILADYMQPVTLCISLSAANAVCAFWLLTGGPARTRPVPPATPVSSLRWSIGAFRTIAVLLLIAAAAVLLMPRIQQAIDRKTLAMRWRKFDPVTSVNSRFGNLAITRNDSQLSLFRDGNLAFTSDDYKTTEWTVHTAVPQLSSPDRILIVGAGNPLIRREVFKYNVSSVTVIDPDPVLIQLVQKWFASGDGSPKVKTIVGDARSQLLDVCGRYDLILVNLPDPSTAALNRYYTVEFFRLAQRLLSKKGVLALTLTSHEAYLRGERRLIHASIYKALRTVFSDVSCVPGYTVHILATNRRSGLITSHRKLWKRLQRRTVETDFATKFNLRRRLMPFKVQMYRQAVEDIDAPVNTDLRPVTYRNYLRLWLRQHAAAGLNILPWLKKAPKAALLLVAVAGLLSLLAMYKPLYLPAARISFITAAIGFVELSLQLCIVLGFQSLAGYLYHQVAILIALNMGGLALGGWLGGLAPLERRAPILLPISAALIAALAYLYGPAVHALQGSLHLVPWCMAGLALITGILGGVHFPLGVALAAGDADERTAAGSSLYGWDLMGGAAAAAIVGLAVIPAIGLQLTGATAGYIAIAALITVAPVCIRRLFA